MHDITPSRLTYGDDPDQFVEFFEAASKQDSTVVVLVHGGYWRSALTAELMEPLVQHFLSQDISVANVEYRRGVENPWPTPLKDVQSAVQTLREHTRGELFGIGHSVGGQLVLLAEKSFDSVVALAPVTDAARIYTERWGDDAAQEYFQRSPEAAPTLYASASAVHQAAVGTNLLVVHGNNDDRVPLRHSLDYVAAQWESGAAVDTLFLAFLDHLECIDPQHAAWTYIMQWLENQRGRNH